MSYGWRLAKGFFYVAAGSFVVGITTRPSAGVGVALACLGVLILVDAVATKEKSDLKKLEPK